MNLADNQLYSNKSLKLWLLNINIQCKLILIIENVELLYDTFSEICTSNVLILQNGYEILTVQYDKTSKQSL